MRKLITAMLAAATTAAAASVVLAPVAAMAQGTRLAAHQADLSQLTTQCLAASSQHYRRVPWAQQQLTPDRVWDMTTGRRQVVAVVDSGVSATAPGLVGAVLPGRDMLTGQHGDNDCLGHGTFTAGLIAARPTQGTGLEGVAPGAIILPVGVVSPSQAESTNPVTSSRAVADGIVYAVNAGATIVDISTAITPGPSHALRTAVSYAQARNVVVIAPVSSVTGVNETNPANVVSYPAAYPGVLAVSGIDSTGAPIALGTPGVRVDITAPGANLVSLDPRGGGDISGAGAALATAFVAGAAALVRSYYPNLSAAAVVHRLEMTADQPGTDLPDPDFGYGFVDPYTAVTTVLPEESGAVAPQVPAAQPLHLPPPRPPDNWPINTALLICAGVAAGLATGGAVVNIRRHGRSRNWQPR